MIDPNNPTGAVYPASTRRALIEFAEEHGLTILADEVYGDLAFDGPVPPLATPRPRRADHLVLEPVEGVSRARAGEPAGWRSARRRGWTACWPPSKKLADGRLCSPGPMQYAVTAALTGDRSHQVTFREALRERARADHASR